MVGFDLHPPRENLRPAHSFLSGRAERSPVAIVLLATFLLATLHVLSPTARARAADGDHATPLDLKVIVRPKIGLAVAPGENAQRPAGMAVEILEGIAAKCGCTLRWVMIPPDADVAGALRSGQGDLVVDWGVTEDRAKEFAFSVPYVTMPVNLFVRKGSDVLKDRRDLGGLKVGVVERNVSDDIFSSRKDILLYRYSDIYDALFHLLAGEIDAVSHLSPVLLKEAQTAGIDDRIDVVDPPIAESPRAYAFRKGSPELVARLDEAVLAFVGTPEYQRIYMKWFGKPKSFWTAQRLVAANAAGAFLLAMAMWVWRYSSVVRLNRELAESRARFASLAESTGDLVWELDPGGTIAYVSPAIRNIFGYEPEEVVGRSAFDLMTPESGDRVRRIYEDAVRQRKPVTGLEQEGVHKSGRIVHLEAAGVPFFGGDGTLLGLRGIDRDITSRKRLEEELRRSEMERLSAQRYEAVGKLAGGIAHNLNNLMTVISGYGSLLLNRLNGADTGRREISEILNAVERAAALTGQLLSFSRQSILLPETRVLDDLVDALVPSLGDLLGPGIALSVRKRAGTALIRVDAKQFGTVVEELAKNARDAMPDGGQLVVATGVEDVTDGPTGKIRPVPPGRYVTFSVADTGRGMDRETLAHIYEPFYTTKGLGRGMGLPAIYGFVRQCRGFVDVDSAPGKGTTITIGLPLVE